MSGPAPRRFTHALSPNGDGKWWVTSSVVSDSPDPDPGYIVLLELDTREMAARIARLIQQEYDDIQTRGVRA
jgi:hypothetical protein